MSEPHGRKPSFSPFNFADDNSENGIIPSSADPHEFNFPPLDKSVEEGNRNLLSRSLKDFLPAVFEQVLPDQEIEDSQNLENTRQRLLDQLEKFKKDQEQELYQMRLEAERQAEELVKQADLEALEIRRKAEERGFQEGLKRGEERMMVQMNSLAEMLSGFVSLKRDLMKQYEDQLLDLSMFIARKIVHQELVQHPEAIVAIARETIREMPVKGSVTLKVHPDDHQVLHDLLPTLQSEFEQLEQVRLVATEGLERGSCILETPVGQVDAGIHTRFDEIRNALLD